MRHTIALTEPSERVLRKIADQGGKAPDQTLAMIAEALLSSKSTDFAVGFKDGIIRIEASDIASIPIRSTPDVMGGDACIRNTRIPVWLVVRYKQSGLSDEGILANYPGLTAADLIAAWDYYAAHSDQVESERRSHEEAM